MNLEDVYNSNEIEIEKNPNDIEIQIDKEKISLEKIVLYYVILEEFEIGKKLTVTASLDSEDEEEQGDETSTQTEECTVTIVKKSNSSQEDTNQNNKNESNIDDTKKDEIIQNDKLTTNQTQINNLTNMDSSKATTNLASKSINNSTQQTTETITYNGSGNNYLNELKVTGYELNKTFNKESSTYFIVLENEEKQLEITTNAEDSKSTVCATGNDNIQEGTNKILVTVTAQNGETRNYRIYVTKK